MSKPNAHFQAIMDQVIEFPGFPQVLTTRGFAYSWLSERGWDQSERGYGSLDYAVFAKDAIKAPATPAAERDHWLGQVSADYAR